MAEKKSLENEKSIKSIDPIDASSQLSKGYKGNITSKEAGNFVKKMIYDQELELMSKYNTEDKE